ncbi:MAG: hypothetical protein AB7I19_04500 [Planctomycetota bacterium]
MRNLPAFLRTALMAFLVLCSSPTLAAQTDPATLQAEVTRRFEDLHERMRKLQIVKAATAPDESALLESGNRFIEERSLRTGLDEARALMAAQRWDEALQRLEAVQTDLQRLLDVLLARQLDVDKLLAEIKRLENLKNQVDKLITEQRSEKNESAEAEADQQRVKDLEAAKAEIAALLETQRETRAQTEQQGLAAKPEAAAALSDKQAELEKKTAELGDKLEKLDADAKGRESADKPADESPKEPTEPKEPSSKPAEGGGSCAGNCKAAAGAMSQAKQKMLAKTPERALADMDEAIRRLEAAKKQIEDELNEAQRKLEQLPFDAMAKKQEVTQIKTDKLAAEMEEHDQNPESNPEKKITPGKRNVQQAVPRQKAAAGQLKEFVPGKAKQEQQDAQEKLEQAKKELEDALTQLRQQLADEVLRALEERFGQMLEKQRELSARTKSADRLAGAAVTADGQVPAEVRTRSTAIGRGEHELSGEAGDALKLLQEEGTSAAFPLLVEMLRDDLTQVGTWLDGARTGSATQSLQADIEQTLKDLIDALRRQIEMNEATGQCGMCNGQPALVPFSAELKLIMIKQKRVNKSTSEFDQTVPEASRETDAAKARAEQLSRQQGQVEDLMRKVAQKQDKDATGR